MLINYFAVAIATVLQFVFGALWYSVFFGKQWGEIHGFNKLSKEVQKEMMNGMGLFYAIQFLITALSTYVLALFDSTFSQQWHAYGIAGFVWLGFILPAQISAALFGGTEKKWIVKKIAIQAGASLACLMIAASILYNA